MTWNYYERRTNCQKAIDPLIIKKEPFIKIVYEATKHGFGESFVKKRMDLINKYIEEVQHNKKQRQSEVSPNDQ